MFAVNENDDVGTILGRITATGDGRGCVKSMRWELDGR
jgi:hypothetical protein